MKKSFKTTLVSALAIFALACSTFIPAGISGLLTDKTLERFYTPTCVATGLMLGSIGIFLIENFRKTHQPCCDDLYDLSVAKALFVGLLQTVALWPGFSRLLSTVLGGIWVGLTLTQALRFSFLLGLLTTALATTYKFLKHSDVLLQATDGVTAWICGHDEINERSDIDITNAVAVGHHECLIADIFSNTL